MERAPSRPYSEDVAYFVRTSPYLTLAKPESAVAFLRRQVDSGREGLQMLRQYPQAPVEPLGFFYNCLRSLGALDQAFFEALTQHQNFRGVVWGAWLAMLDPQPGFSEPLRAAGPNCPENEWLVACAISVIEGRSVPSPHEEIVLLAGQCRALLEGIPRPYVPLRREPTEDEVAQIARERAIIRSAYAARGAAGAQEAMVGTLAAYYAQEYPEWVKSVSEAGPKAE